MANYAGLRGATYQNELYRNDGNGKLALVTGEAAYSDLTDRNFGPSIALDGSAAGEDPGVENAARVVGAADACWGDYDGDGFVDIFLAMGGYTPLTFEDQVIHRPAYRNLLYHNEGIVGGVHQGFALVTDGVGNDLLADEFPSTGCAFADYDGDGDLDLYVTNTADTSANPANRYPNQLYRNDAGSFVKVLEGPLVTDNYPATVPSWADFGACAFERGVTPHE